MGVPQCDTLTAPTSISSCNRGGLLDVSSHYSCHQGHRDSFMMTDAISERQYVLGAVGGMQAHVSNTRANGTDCSSGQQQALGWLRLIHAVSCVCAVDLLFQS